MKATRYDALTFICKAYVLSTSSLWKICAQYLATCTITVWLDDSCTEFAAHVEFGEAFSYKGMKNNKYQCQKYFTQLLEQQKNIYVV